MQKEAFDKVALVLDEVLDERLRQHLKWGEQNHPDGTSGVRRPSAEIARRTCEREHRAGRGTWLHILDEEVCEAYAEEGPLSLRKELIQVAAVAVAWVEAIDRRHS
jgi:hypothetical protein